jgi:hypothetical protein
MPNLGMMKLLVGKKIEPTFSYHEVAECPHFDIISFFFPEKANVFYNN